ncbi:MAG: orotidine 5'-phosphate decarboxylase, partial [Phycisphaerae bacterium]|nr:orotidine 5'-phosphate decarboxylase [Phycisphaerae bacterium]
MASHFGDRLYKAVKSKKTPLIVGLDPVYGKLPAVIRQTKSLSDENDAAAAIDAIFEYSTKVLKVIAPLVPAVKINIAFFEKYLWEGIECYYSLISEAQ